MRILLVIICICTPLAFASFSYTDQSTWLSLGQCAGSAQSPINFPCAESVIKCPAKKSYSVFVKNPEVVLGSSEAEDISRSITTQNIWLRYSNQTNDYLFKSARFHFHQPSEHTIDGKQYDLQLHIVHSLTNSKIAQYAVLGVLFEVDDALVTDLFDNSDLFSGHVQQTINFPLHLDNRQAYHYRGSLTTPPCLEAVNFFIHAQPHKITRRNLNKFKARINEGNPNNRLTQRIGDRTVYLLGNQCQTGVSSGHSM